ncbi:MAG: protein-L-isoaspartate O-methyltransferase [Candidatus Bathyarchaeota archaeon]|nr:protein-L-isoaspartate O-methyltransferase [Candidatus Bathyarchaeota archaeon]
MIGWIVPPPRKPEKTKEQFLEERVEKVRWLIREGFLKSERIIKAMLKVPREEFIPEVYRDYAYHEVPLPLPGSDSTISCPHSYPLFYEALELTENDRFLEIGAGSGYGAALAREIVGQNGRVTTVEIDRETYEFALMNLRRSGYKDVLVVHADGSLGYDKEAPYDKMCVTAACPRIPEPLIGQLGRPGKLVAPVGYSYSQDLILLEKSRKGSVRTRTMEKVLYVLLKGRHGWQV